MTQTNHTSSTMPAKNQILNEKEVLLKHIGHFPFDLPPEGYKWYLMIRKLLKLNIKHK